MIRVAPAFALVLPLTALAATAPGHIGDLLFDSARWEVRENGDAYDVVCRTARCDASITVTIASAEKAACSEAALRAMPALQSDRKVTTISRPGFDIHVATEWTGCRNARPPSVQACTLYKGQVYTIVSPVAGCSGGPGFSDGALEFLESLSGD